MLYLKGKVNLASYKEAGENPNYNRDHHFEYAFKTTAFPGPS
jgi:hypothetical protein